MAITLKGKGTEINPYIISSGSDLAQIQQDPTAYYQLDRSIDLTEICNQSDGTGWTPITNFSGTFDGNGFMIRNLFINRNADNQALFGTTRGATVMNFGLIDANVTGNSTYCAMVVGNMTSYDDTVKNVFVTGTNTAETNNSGFVGKMNGGTIKNCYSEANVFATNTSNSTCVGLVYEMATNNCRVEKCFFNGYLTGCTNPQPYTNPSVNNGGHIMEADCYNHYNSTNVPIPAQQGALDDAEMKNSSNFTDYENEYYNFANKIWVTGITDDIPRLFFERTTQYLVSFKNEAQKDVFYTIGVDSSDKKRKWLKVKDIAEGSFPTAQQFEQYGLTDNELTAISRFEWNQLRELTDEFELLASTDKYVVNRSIEQETMTIEQELTDAIVLSKEIDFRKYGDSINQIKILQ